MRRAGIGSRRLTIAALAAALLAFAVAAPAQAATKTRYYEDRSVDGGGNLRLDVIFKNKKPKGKYTPRILKLLTVEIMPISCQPGGDQFLASIQPTKIKLTKGKFVFPISDDNFSGEARGQSVKKGKKFDGTFEVFDFDPSPMVQNCTTDGPRVFHAGQCRKPNQNKKLPVCRF